MRSVFPLLLCLFVTACGGDDSPKKSTACSSDSDYLEFECIRKADFISSTGAATELSKTIADCTIISSTQASCPLNTLAFIANQITPPELPSKQHILDRLIVSDAWMAENFARLLDRMPDDMKNLFASTTAIVIHRNIRPAFFTPITGAIYLDPYYLWLSQAQYDSISKKDDYRGDYGNTLAFESFWRYTYNGEYAFSSAKGRSEDQTLYALSTLLFHELAHARDFFPSSAVQSASLSDSPESLAPKLSNLRTSSALQQSFPLTNSLLLSLANISFAGTTPTPNESKISAREVGDIFATEGANDLYAYADKAEDAAMLFEETMMKLHFNVDREVAFVTPLNAAGESCSDFSFDWVSINLYAKDNVIRRAKFVVDRLLPDHHHANFLANPVHDGVFSWCTPAFQYYRSLPNRSQDKIQRDYWR
jgi:hypothetical protein